MRGITAGAKPSSPMWGHQKHGKIIRKCGLQILETRGYWLGITAGVVPFGWKPPAGVRCRMSKYPREWVGNADAGPGVPAPHPDLTGPWDR